MRNEGMGYFERGEGMELKNTYVIRTDDDNFRKALDEFLASHCEERDANAAVFEMNQKGAKEVMEIVFG